MQNCNSKFKTDLRARCYYFSLDIINLVNILPNNRNYWVIANQLMRSATSIGANLIESKTSSSRLEFKKFNEIALKSTNETEYWLGLLNDAKLVDGRFISLLINEVKEIAKMLASGILKLKNIKF